jgi:type II secretory pathway predicted ATPase ExeA
MGALFEINLSPANRYGGFKSLRTRWREHFKSTLLKPVLLVDEAQEMVTPCLNELRLLGSANFDSECLLTTVLCGDNRLPERFRGLSLVSLGSRIQVRRHLEPYNKDDLLDYLRHAVETAGAPALMTMELMQTLAEHAGGYLRVLNSMANDLLIEGAQKEMAQLDEKLFLEVYSRTPNRKSQRKEI